MFKLRVILLAFFLTGWIFSAFIYIKNEWYYLDLIKDICKTKEDNKEKTLALFNWTINHIKPAKVRSKTPWFLLTAREIIEKGEGLCSESARVFVILCQKAGLKAQKVNLYHKRFNFFGTTDQSPRSHAVAVVFLERKWVVFDTFWGKVFYRDKKGLASIQDIRKHPWIVDNTLSGIYPPLSEYYYKVRYINWNRYSWLIKIHTLGYYLVGKRIDEWRVPNILMKPESLFLYFFSLSLIFLLIKIKEGLFVGKEKQIRGICMVIAHFPPTVGGTERQAEILAHHLQNRGFPISVVTMEVHGEKIYEISKGVRIYRLPSYLNKKRSSFFFLINLGFFLIKKRKSYDIIHAYLASSPAIVCAIIGMILRKKRVLKLGASREYGDVRTSEKTWRGRLKLFLLRRYIQIVIVTNMEMKNELLERGFSPERIILIPNGVDTERFSPLSEIEADNFKEKLGYSGKRFITFIGRLEPQKDVATLIMSWKKIKDKFPHLLLIVGDGSEMSVLKNLVKKLNIEDKVIFVGSVPSEKISLYHQISELFVLPSLSEGISNSLLESMACAKAIVATRIGGNCEVIEDGVNGILFTPRDNNELAMWLEILLNDSDRRRYLGRNARETILKNYSISLIVTRYVQLYQKLLNN